MKSFTKIGTVETRTNTSKTIKVQICKFQKEGTKRIFFAPEFDGKRLNSTLFVRKYDAVRLAKQFIDHKTKTLK